MKCNESKDCFAKFSHKDGTVTCMCLSGRKQYKDGECPFRKLDGCVTNGIDYEKKGEKNSYYHYKAVPDAHGLIFFH